MTGTALQAGALKSRVLVLRRVVGEDPAGQPSTSWVAHVKVFADIRHAAGIQAARAGGEVSIVRASIRIRQRSDISAGMRVEHRARGITTVYDIEAVPPPVAGQDYTDLVCKAVR